MNTREMKTRSQSPTPQDLSLNERLGLISLIDEGMRLGSPGSPALSDLFNNLWDLVQATVSGSKINRLKPEDTQNGFRVFEINSESGENLGRLNMLYLKKPLPCYYLVYVEVAAPFRKNGLGNRILESFREFLVRKSAVGLLDNIIPEEDPTFDIYQKQAWEPLEAVIGDALSDEGSNYMIYIPPRLQGKPIRESVIKLVHHLKRKRAAIDMRDNEMMVQRTIREFKDLYAALLTYFKEDIQQGRALGLMRFMFTRFVTKMIAFRRRIGGLIGYTGGESMEQIVLDPEIAALPVQSYAPQDLPAKPSFVTGDTALWLQLPEALKNHPAHFIESLPNYRRPSLLAWLKEKGRDSAQGLTIGDLLDLGFDPTRLKEMTFQGEPYIFERIQARQIPELEKKRRLLEQAASHLTGVKAVNATVKVNPPLLVIRDRGNAYVLRRKVEGIHWEEAVDQLRSASHLKGLNTSMKVDRMVLATVREATTLVTDRLGLEQGALFDLVTSFVSWDLESNRPKLMIDFSDVFLESVWMA